MLNFNITPATIELITMVVNQNGSAWVTGCGNVYDNEQAAKVRKMYTNPDVEEATYLCKFLKGDKIPSTPQLMEEALFNSRKSELQQHANSTKIETKQVYARPSVEETKDKSKTKGV